MMPGDDLPRALRRVQTFDEKLSVLEAAPPTSAGTVFAPPLAQTGSVIPGGAAGAAK